MDILVYDIEIAKEVKDVPGGWGNPYGMGLGSVVIYSYNEDRFYKYLHDSSRWAIQEKLNGNRVITFNGINFDSKVLLGNKRTIGPGGSEFSVTVTSPSGKISWVEFDILTHCLKDINKCKTLLEAVNKRSFGGNKMNEYAMNTLGEEFMKSGDGGDAPKLYKAGRYEDLSSYNKQDVIITKMLFDYARKNKYLINGHGCRIKIEMN